MTITIRNHRAKNGWAFPIDAREIRAAFRSVQIAIDDGVEVHCQTPSESAESLELLKVDGPTRLTVYAVPVNLAAEDSLQERVRTALCRAAELMSDPQRTWKQGETYVTYVFCLDADLKRWKLVQRVTKFAGYKYRGIEKFKNAFKPRNVSRTEKVVEVETCEIPNPCPLSEYDAE